MQQFCDEASFHKLSFISVLSSLLSYFPWYLDDPEKRGDSGLDEHDRATECTRRHEAYR